MNRFEKGDDFAANTVAIDNSGNPNDHAIYGIHDKGTPGEDGVPCHDQKIEVYDDAQLRDRVLSLLNDGVTYYHILDTMSHWAPRFGIPTGSVAGIVAIMFNKDFKTVLDYYEYLLRDNAKHAVPPSDKPDKPASYSDRRMQEHVQRETDPPWGIDGE